MACGWSTGPKHGCGRTFRSPRYHGGLFDPEGFHLDPLRLCEGYAAAAEKLGARIHEGTPALALERRPDGFHIRTPRGGVTADRVILCQSVYPPPLHPPLARAGLAVVSYIIVTEPLGERGRQCHPCSLRRL